VLPGLTTQKGTSPGSAGCDDHDEPLWDSMSERSREMFSLPTTSRKSAQAASMFASEMLCLTGGKVCSGAVEDVSALGGFSWP
jgi:hypothetical protein